MRRRKAACSHHSRAIASEPGSAATSEAACTSSPRHSSRKTIRNNSRLSKLLPWATWTPSQSLVEAPRRVSFQHEQRKRRRAALAAAVSSTQFISWVPMPRRRSDFSTRPRPRKSPSFGVCMSHGWPKPEQWTNPTTLFVASSMATALSDSLSAGHFSRFLVQPASDSPALAGMQQQHFLYARNS